MTNNQLINGVSRLLVEEVLAGMSTTAGRRALRPKLRALLDAPAEPFSHDGWSIDHSAGRPILMHNKCSVIEAEQAYGLLALIQAAAQPQGEQAAVGFLKRMLKGSGDDRLAAWQGEMAMVLEHIAENKPKGVPVAWQIRTKTNREDSNWTEWAQCSEIELALHSHEAGKFNRFGIVREIRPVYAEQPQGEPVVWLDPESGRKASTISAALKKYNEGKGGAPASVAASYTVPLYRGRPALAQTVQGWKLVPIKPTLEMLKAVDDEAGDKHLARGRAASAWGLMLDAAPLPSILDLPFDLAHAVECELPERDLVGGHKLGGVYFPTPSHLASAVAGAGDGVALEPAAPILVEAVAVTRESTEDGLCLEWLVEGGIAALEFPGTYLLVAQGELTNDSGNGYVYRARNQEDDA